MNLEEKAILADQVIEPFDLVQLQQNVRLTSEPEIGAKLARQSLEASFVTTGESGSSGC